MIGRILDTSPLTGAEATKDEVINRLSSVGLVHIAAHGRMKTGEIALAPNHTRASRLPTEEDFILKTSDVMSVQMRAKLVVLSCCHSGRGKSRLKAWLVLQGLFLLLVLDLFWCHCGRLMTRPLKSFWNISTFI